MKKTKGNNKQALTIQLDQRTVEKAGRLADSKGPP